MQRLHARGERGEGDELDGGPRGRGVQVAVAGHVDVREGRPQASHTRLVARKTLCYGHFIV